MTSTPTMTSYDPYPEKLPSISTLNQKQQENDIGTYSQDMPFSTFVPNADMYGNSTASSTNNDMQLDLYNLHHLSPPLTPAVSPSNMMDPMQFKRKYSVDVGPFGFNAHPSLMHDQDAFRRSSCSAMSVDDCLQEHQDPLQQQQQMIQYQPDYAYFNDGSSPMTDHLETAVPTDMNNGIKSTNKRKSGQHYQQGPNAPHKHVCKYSYCGWSFKRYEHLKRHMLVHTGERPHICAFPGCGKSFSRSDNFHAHYRTHIKKQSISSPQNQAARRGSKKSGPPVGGNINLPVVSSPSPSASSISSQQDLIQNFAGTQPFVFNGKSFDVPYPDVYGQSSFTSDVQDQYSSMTSQSYLPLDMAHDGISSLLNHDQVSSPMFPSNVLAPAYDLQCDYTNFQSTNGMLPPPSPTLTLNNTGNNTGAIGNNKKQRKYKSTLLHCNNNTPAADGGQQKSHVCPMTQCQRRFKRLEHLKRHMRIHTLERPFACTYPKCHKHFSRSDNLSQHMKTHQHRPGQDKRRNSSNSSSSSSSSNSSVSPRSIMDDFNSTSTMINHHPSTIDTFSTSGVISSLPSCWTSESVSC